MEKSIESVLKVKHGFKPIEQEARKIFASRTTDEVFKMGMELLGKEEYQLRCLAVFLLGYLSSEDNKAWGILKEKVSRDTSWQVQEILAKSFDEYCRVKGYEVALPVIKEWLADQNPNVRRAVTEGLRIWTNRPYFETHPEVAINLLNTNKDSDSKYLRKSVGNALRDIAKRYPELVAQKLMTWDLTNEKVNYTYKLVKKHKKGKNERKF